MPRPYLRQRRLILLAATTVALLATAIACGDGDPAGTSSPGSSASLTPSPIPLPTVTVVFVNGPGDEVELVVEVADAPEERQRGLMFRESLPEDRGMLFDFGGETSTGFWMKNTTIPLSIAFIEGEGDVLHIQDLEPLNTALQYSPEPYTYAVEVNRGWFERNGVEVGSGIRIALP